MSYVYIGCGTLIAFIATLIAGKKGKTPADFLLIVWLLVLGLNILAFFVLDIHHGAYPESLAQRVIVEFTDASVFLHGPIFLCYTLALSQAGFKLRKEHLLHLIPFALSFLFLIYGAVIADGKSYEARMWLSLLKMSSVFLYTLSVIKQLRKHRRAIRDIYSNVEEKNLDWLNFLSWGIMIVWLISAGSLILSLLTRIPLDRSVSLLPNLAICLFIYLMGYFGVRQNTIFVTQAVEDLPPEIVGGAISGYPNQEPERKYKKSGLGDEKADQLFITLSAYMDACQPYLNPELSLFDLARLLKVLPNHLSQVINVKTSQNFFDYINVYRVKTVKTHILDGRLAEHNLLGIAMDSGFNSKASFNRAFKKHTGLTPSAFRNQNPGPETKR